MQAKRSFPRHVSCSRTKRSPCRPAGPSRATRARPNLSPTFAPWAANPGPLTQPPLVWIASPERSDGRAHRRRGPALRVGRRQRAARARGEDPPQPVLRGRLHLCLPGPPAGHDARRDEAGRPVRRAHVLARGLASRRQGGRDSAARGQRAATRRARTHPQRPPRRRRLALRHADRLGTRAGKAGVVGQHRRRRDGERRAGRRRRGLGRPFRARHRAPARRWAPFRPARGQLLLPRCPQREGHPRRARAAGQLPRRPEQRAGLVPALVHRLRHPARRTRGRAAAGRAQPALPAVLAPEPQLPALDDELRLDQRRHAARPGLERAVARSREPRARLALDPGHDLQGGQGVLGPHHLRVPDRGPHAPHARSGLRGDDRRPAAPGAQRRDAGRRAAGEDARRGSRGHRRRARAAAALVTQARHLARRESARVPRGDSPRPRRGADRAGAAARVSRTTARRGPAASRHAPLDRAAHRLGRHRDPARRMAGRHCCGGSCAKGRARRPRAASRRRWRASRRPRGRRLPATGGA